MGRLCGADCPRPDDVHREPERDWIGDTPILHGDSGHPVPDSGWIPESIGFRIGVEHFCLCGHPDYFSCPELVTGGIAGMVIERGPEWRPDDTEA